MNIIIKSLKLHNFKKFKDFEIKFNDKYNVIIGDNESGKSTILQAIDLCLSGSNYKTESIGISELFNTETIDSFLSGTKEYDKIPIVSIEITTNDFGKYEYEGKKNSYNKNLYGVKMLVIPNDEYSEEIKEVLSKSGCHFPFEYFKIEFRTYADNAFNTYNKKIKHYFIDNTTINSETSMKEFTSNMYKAATDLRLRQKHLSEFRSIKQKFENEVLGDFNQDKDYKFKFHKSQKFDLENNLAIYDQGVSIWNKGKGKQTVIKTELAIDKKSENVDILLLEEPENHLSSNNMLKMIDNILNSVDQQMIITTHSNLILTRLELKNAYFIHTNNCIAFSSLDDETVNFFNKQTNSNLLQFILSNRAILIEGASEYILIETFYEKITGKQSFSEGTSIISINGLSFLRYLEIAEKLGIKVAVITDNDGNYAKNVQNKYSKYSLINNIGVFSDIDNVNSTFEIGLYNNNKIAIDNSTLTTTKDKISYMINNKSESAVRLLKMLEAKEIELVIPSYIKDAIEWIKK